MENLESFLIKIRQTLAEPSCANDSYLDLASVGNIPLIGQLIGENPPQDKLAVFQELMMEEIRFCRSDRIKIGINELLKNLLAKITPEQELYLAELHLYRLRMIFKRCLMPDFPYPEEVWNYLCDCLRTVGKCLMDNGHFNAAREVIDSLAGMGRIAALKGLPTANTQSSLRILENKALEKNQKQLAVKAKNARFNLET